jgi:hypothetical protein
MINATPRPLFFPGKENGYPSYSSLNDSRIRSGEARKISPGLASKHGPFSPYTVAIVPMVFQPPYGVLQGEILTGINVALLGLLLCKIMKRGTLILLN